MGEQKTQKFTFDHNELKTSSFSFKNGFHAKRKVNNLEGFGRITEGETEYDENRTNQRQEKLKSNENKLDLNSA